MTEAELRELAAELDIPVPRRGTAEYALWRSYALQAWKALRQGNRALALLWAAEAEEIALRRTYR